MAAARKPGRTRPPATKTEEGAAGQAIWSGTVSFSLVAIPVRLVNAVEPGRVSFRMLHGKDYAPLLRRMYCPREEKIVPPEEIVRGYEVAPGKYVTVTDEELESLAPERSRTIEILEFIDLNDVDPLHFDRPYYLVPAKGGEKAYALLVEVLRRTKKAGLAKFVLAEREHLVALKSEGGALSLITLHYGGDIVPAAEFAPKQETVESAARRLVEREVRKLIGDFTPAKYADLRRKRIVDLLRKKAEKAPPVEGPAVEGREERGEGPAPPDLVAALREAMHAMKKEKK
ncbi:MAG TPA: Ku protein [bacterium]